MSDIDRDRWLFSRDALMNSPSREDDVSWDMEKSYRRITCLFIVELGNLLQSGHSKVSARGAVAVSAACMLFHRFYVFQSFKKHNRFIIAATCLFLAMKIEECPRNIDSIINCYCSARRLKNPSQEVLKELRESILVAERIVLHTLCFDFQLEHPIGLCVLKVKTDLKSYVPDDRKVELVNTALNFLRDSNGTLLSLLYNANKIALGAIFMATLQLGISPLQPRAGLTTMSRLHSAGLSWFDLIKNDIDVDSLKDICYQIMEVYELQQKSSSSRSSKWADVDVDAVKREVNKLHSSGEGGVYGHGMEDVKNTEIGQDHGQQERYRTDVENRVRSKPYKSGSSCGGSDEEEKEVKDLEEEQWEDPPATRQPTVQVTVFGHGRSASCSSSERRMIDGAASAVSTCSTIRAMAPPTPEFLPPPPTPDFLPPPTPEYLPPPPSSVTSEERNLQPQPTPDFLPPPDSPVDGSGASVSDTGAPDCSSSRGKVKFSPALHASSETGDGGGSGIGVGGVGTVANEDGGARFNGMRQSLIDPWCHSADTVSPKRARLQ